MKGSADNQRLGKYVMRSYILFAVIPMMLACSICIFAVAGFYEHANRAEMQSNIQNMAAELDQRLEDCRRLLSECVTNAVIAGQVGEEKTLNQEGKIIVNALMSGRRSGLQLHILSDDGRFRYSTGAVPNLYKLPTYREVDYFRQMRSQGFVARATKFTTYNGRQIALSMGMPIGGISGGYAILDITRDELQRWLSSYDSAYISDVLLVGAGGKVSFCRSGQIAEGVTLREEWALDMLESARDGGIDVRGGYALPVQAAELKLLVAVENDFIRPIISSMLLGLGSMAAFALLIATFCGGVLSKRISRQMDRLVTVCRHAPASGFHAKYASCPGDFREISLIGEHFNEMNDQVRGLIAGIQDKQRLLANAELNLLKAQMRPHFIYNVFNDVKALAKLGRTKEIVDLVVCFAALMRSTLATEEEFYTVGEELDLVKKYVQMQNLRGTVPIRLDIRVDGALAGMQIPRLILQPLVENSIAHGLPGRPRPAISIQGRRTEAGMIFSVTDNGAGISNARQHKPMDAVAYHRGIGLKNIEGRLRLYYGDHGALCIASREGCYTKITLMLGNAVACAEN